MDVTASISLPDADRDELARILECPKSKLAEHLEPFARAALTELVAMFLGQRVFTRGSDILEHRLFLLTQHAFNNRVPTEKQVSKLFQTTATGSRALLRAVMSKYQYQLRSAISATLKTLLKEATKADDGVRTVSVLNQNLVDELNRLLTGIDPTLPPLTKKRGAVSQYEIPASSFARLEEALGPQ